MVSVRVITGDEDGGPHADVTYYVKGTMESLTDEVIRECRRTAMQTYSWAFGGPPEAVIVTIDEADPAGAALGDNLREDNQ